MRKKCLNNKWELESGAPLKCKGAFPHVSTFNRVTFKRIPDGYDIQVLPQWHKQQSNASNLCSVGSDVCPSAVRAVWVHEDKTKTHKEHISETHDKIWADIKVSSAEGEAAEETQSTNGPAALREPFKTPWKWHVGTILDSGKPINLQFWLEWPHRLQLPASLLIFRKLISLVMKVSLGWNSAVTSSQTSPVCSLSCGFNSPAGIKIERPHSRRLTPTICDCF